MRDQLKAVGKSFNIFFITIDPARDTVAALGEFIPYFGEGITGITGEAEAVYALARAWGIFWEKNNITDTGYNIDHTATVFLLDDKGYFKGTIDYHESREIALKKLERLTASR